jgi:uncharacterized protein YfaS (alpha-2-macroglobulin family)
MDAATRIAQFARPRRPFALLGTGALFLATVSLAGLADRTPLSVVHFTPDMRAGADARNATQALVRFDRPMVQFGDPRAPAPLDVACKVAGDGRWIDERTWVYEFKAALPSGLRCSASTRKDLKALDGAVMVAPQDFVFESGGPVLISAVPGDDGESVDGAQVFLVLPDGTVDPASVREHAQCSIEGVVEGVAVNVLSPTDRDRAIAALGDEGGYLARLTNPAAPWDGAREDRIKDILALSCARPLPAGKAMSLVWGRGIRSLDGVVYQSEQRLRYRVREDFNATLTCDRINPRADCLPLGGLRLRFSAPVTEIRLAKVRLVDATTGRVYPAQFDGAPARATRETLVFPGPFPARARVRVELPPGLVDDAGRPLVNAAKFPLTVPLDDLPPLAKFGARFGVLELKAAPALPLTLRGLVEPGGLLPQPVANAAPSPGAGAKKPEALATPPLAAWRVAATDEVGIMAWLRRYEEAYDTGVPLLTARDPRVALRIPRGDARTTEVVGVPLPHAGLHIVEVPSPRLGEQLSDRRGQIWHVRAAALVTNLAVHFKQGAESSLVWVTALDTAKPVPSAEVTIRNCVGGVMWKGRTDASGLARVTERLPEAPGNCNGLWGLFVFARLAGDIAFVRSSWDEGISPWDFGLPYADTEPSRVSTHAVLDRKLVRAGETVHLKLFRRQPTQRGFALPTQPAGTFLRVQHLGSGREWTQPLAFTDGNAVADFAVPRDAPLGDYRLEVGYKVGKAEATEDAGSFEVSEFRLPAMRARLQLPATPLVAVKSVQADAMVTYLAGGGASGAPVTVRWRAEPASVSMPGFNDFTFSASEIVEGVRGLSGDCEECGSEDSATEEAEVAVSTRPLTLDANGSLRTTLELTKASEQPRWLVAEMDYPDANGQRLTVSARERLWPADRVIGLRTARSPRQGEAFPVAAVVLDLQGRPVAGAEVTITAYARTVYSWRKRLFGGFYGYENQQEVKRAGTVCTARTDVAGRLRCTSKLDIRDSVILEARTKDTAGRPVRATETRWLAGSDAWWGGHDSERMDVIPAQRRYVPGTRARLEAHMPFHSSTALVTVEREGVIDAWVMPLSAERPAFEVPMRAHYGPNVFISVLAVRGRVTAPAPTAFVDLGKPTFRLGYTMLQVGTDANRLSVDVKADAAVYPTRGKAQVVVSAKRADGTPAAGAEIAMVAVDDALLELAPNDTWDVGAVLTGERSLRVHTATAALQVQGKRHYGRKAMAAGGGGGRLPTRELFDTLLLWRARVPLDAAGQARLQVPLNDSLSSFTVAAIAHQGVDRFGFGTTQIKTHRDLMLFSGAPETVREGERVESTATLRNAANRTLVVTPMARVTGVDAAGKATALVVPALAPVKLAAGEAREVVVAVDVPRGLRRLEWEWSASSPGVPGDSVKTQGAVLPWPAAAGVLQAQLVRVDRPIAIPVATPKDAVPGVGGVRVQLSPSLVGGLEGVRDYLREYPYECLEQKTSRAVGLGDATRWEAAMRLLPVLLDDSGLARYWAYPSEGSVALTAQLLSISAASRFAIPEGPRTRMLDALVEIAEGRRALPGARYAGDSLLLRLQVVEALAQHGRATPAMVVELLHAPEAWPTSALVDALSIVQHVAMPEAAKWRTQLGAMLRNRLVYNGTRASFGAASENMAWWLMESPDETAARALLLLAQEPRWAEELPKLAVGLLARQQRGHWDTTVANAWGAVAVRDFAARFEAVPVSGTTTASLAGATRTDTTARAMLQLPWPEGAAKTSSGKDAGTLRISHEGTGAPWATVQSVAAIPLVKPLVAGYRVTREVTVEQATRPGKLTRGDVLRITLRIEAAQDMAWVAISDPVPTGGLVLGGTARSSASLGSTSVADNAPTWVERGQGWWRGYFNWLPTGKHTVEYRVRLNSAGRFQLPATRVEAMYAPDVFGATPNRALEVGAQ